MVLCCLTLLIKDYTFQRENVISGDAGSRSSSYCLTPFRGVPYHLREWAQGQDRPQNAKELFNCEIQLRNVIERIFGNSVRAVWSTQHDSRTRMR